MGKLKEKYADEIIRQMEQVKNGMWVDWIDEEAFKQIIGEVSVFTADFIKYENKETGEAAEFVSKRKLREVLEKMREYRDMEIKGVNFYKRPGVAERCFDLLQEVIK